MTVIPFPAEAWPVVPPGQVGPHRLSPSSVIKQWWPQSCSITTAHMNLWVCWLSCSDDMFHIPASSAVSHSFHELWRRHYAHWGLPFHHVILATLVIYGSLFSYQLLRYYVSLEKVMLIRWCKQQIIFRWQNAVQQNNSSRLVPRACDFLNQGPLTRFTEPGMSSDRSFIVTHRVQRWVKLLMTSWFFPVACIAPPGIIKTSHYGECF